MYRSNPNKILICGLGSMGKKYLRIIKKNWPNLKIGVVTSQEFIITEDIMKDVEVFNNIRESISWEPEATVIASSANLHIPQAIYLSKLNIPILIEKPLGTGLEEPNDLRTILEFSKKNTLLIGYILRHSPCAEYVKRLISEMKIGKIIEADFHCGSWLPNWREDRDYRKTASSKSNLGGGVLLEVSHEIDLAFWFLGEIELLGSFINNSKILEIDNNIEDTAIIIAKNKQNTAVTIRLNFCTNIPTRKVTLRGNKGEIVWDLLNNNVKIKTNNDTKIYKSDLEIKDLYKLQINHFFSCINGFTQPICKVENGIKVLEFIKKTKALS